MTRIAKSEGFCVTIILTFVLQTMTRIPVMKLQKSLINFVTYSFLHGHVKNVLLSIATVSLFCTACSEKQQDKSANTQEVSPSSEDVTLEEQARIQKEREEQESKEKEREEQLRVERERVERERLEKEREDQVRKAAENEASLAAQKDEARRRAVGQTLERLETLKGDVYENVIIREVSPVGIAIRHDAGSRRIPFEELPVEMQQQFFFDAKEKAKALASERAVHDAHSAQIEAAKVEKSEAQKTGVAEEYRLKVAKAIATKSARIQVLEDEIRSLESDVAREESKKYNNGGYYRHDGRWIPNAIGISRAPEFRKKLDAKRQEFSVLKQQVATLQVELDSMR